MGRVTDTVSGSLATFRTPGKQQIRSLKAYFTPKQEGSGTPSPDNVRPITGWTGVNVERRGKNLFDANNPNIISPGCWVSSNTPHKILASNVDRTIYIKCLPNMTYVISKTLGNVLGAGYTTELPALSMPTYSYMRDNNAKQVIVTTGADAKYLAIWFYDGGKTFDKTVQPEVIYRTLQIEYGSTATDYEPYNGTTLPIDWSSAGTVYGGYVDLVTGEVWETHHKLVADGTSLKCNSSYMTDTIIAAGIVYLNPVGLYSGVSTPNVLADTIPMYTQNYERDHELELPYATCTNAGNQYVIFKVANRAEHPEVTDANTCKNFVNTWLQEHSVTLVYELRTPTLVTTLTPTALRTIIGTNNIWCNSGDVSVEYDFAESREMQEARKRALFSMIWIGGREMKLKKIGTYTVTESWENDQKGNPVTIMNTLVPDRDDTNYEVDYWLEFIGNATSNTNYKVDGIFWNPIETGNKGFVIRNNRSAYRVNSSSTSTWASVGTKIHIYKIQLFS